MTTIHDQPEVDDTAADDEPASRMEGDAEVCTSCGHDLGRRDRCTNPSCETKRPDRDD